ncbi:MAG: hypothetical protein WBG85_04905 [Rhodanobacter sp.]|jgi:uncharacterized membrane protein YphA (DoxX/SURF4 family)
MSNYVCRYPDGSAGLALLILRLGYACVAIGVATMLPADILGAAFLQVATGLAALLLVAGLAARSVALLLGVAVAFALVAAGEPARQWLLAGHVGGCAAIMLVGPGAYSLDARRHGRRVIHLQSNTPDRGSGD